ncbi:hypothetical protein QTN25_008687 [Entamoeba marina]
MVKFIAACLKISPTIFSQELISKIMQLLQFLINIDYVDDAFYLLNAYTFSLSSENLRNIPDIIQMICNRLAEHRTRRLTDNIVKYILQLCYVMDIQTIPTLRIPQGFATLVISNMQKLPTDMNRTTCFVGYLKLLLSPQFFTQIQNPQEVAIAVIQTAVSVIQNKKSSILNLKNLKKIVQLIYLQSNV